MVRTQNERPIDSYGRDVIANVKRLKGRHMRTSIIIGVVVLLLTTHVALLQATVPPLDAQLIQAAATGDVDGLLSLLAKGANIEARNEAGATPLMWASIGGHVQAVAVLLNRGADINARSNSGATALKGAAAHGQLEIVKLLVARGADLHMRDNQGMSSIDAAQNAGQNEIVAFMTSVTEQGAQQGPIAQEQGAHNDQIAQEGEIAQQKQASQPAHELFGAVTGIDYPEQCLRIRKGPGTEFEKVGCAPMGANLKLTGASRNNWAEVLEPVGGWVAMSQIRAEGLFPAKQAASGVVRQGAPAQSNAAEDDSREFVDMRPQESEDVIDLSGSQNDFSAGFGLGGIGGGFGGGRGRRRH
jgi:hypothetical protein